MPPFPKPKFPFDYDVAAELAALRAHKLLRGLPARGPATLLLATWNVANFGEQQRDDRAHRLLAEILSWFDVVALQEVKDNYGPLFDVARGMGPDYRVLMSDIAGNGERAAFIYDAGKVKLLEKIGEIALPPSDLKHVRLPGVSGRFEGFDRSPYLGSFAVGIFSFLLVNVHLFFGSDASQVDVDRRTLETYAVARWANRRDQSAFVFTRNIIVLGDFNMPKTDPNDPIFKALTKLGLELPDHSTQIASAIASDHHYDQIAFLPGKAKQAFTGRRGVFDYDGVIFRSLWQTRPAKDFKAYCRYYISDHRPMWVEFRV